MLESFLFILILFQIKHWYVDFVDQSMDEINSKGNYGEWLGIRHSLKHGVLTYVCIAFMVGAEYWAFALILAVLDFALHYHIDWCKMNYGNRDISTPQFWNHLGMDQMFHQITYILLGYMVVA